MIRISKANKKYNNNRIYKNCIKIKTIYKQFIKINNQLSYNKSNKIKLKKILLFNRIIYFSLNMIYLKII